MKQLLRESHFLFLPRSFCKMISSSSSSSSSFSRGKGERARRCEEETEFIRSPYKHAHKSDERRATTADKSVCVCLCVGD